MVKNPHNMYSDFKYVWLRESGNGVEALVRFYQGDITTENETLRTSNGEKTIAPVTRYRRNGKILEKTLRFPDVVSLEAAIKQELSNYNLKRKVADRLTIIPELA